MRYILRIHLRLLVTPDDFHSSTGVEWGSIQASFVYIHPSERDLEQKRLKRKGQIDIMSSIPLSDSTCVHDASRSFLQSSVSTNAQPGSKENVRLLLYIVCNQRKTKLIYGV